MNSYIFCKILMITYGSQQAISDYRLEKIRRVCLEFRLNACAPMLLNLTGNILYRPDVDMKVLRVDKSKVDRQALMKMHNCKLVYSMKLILYFIFTNSNKFNNFNVLCCHNLYT